MQYDPEKDKCEKMDGSMDVQHRLKLYLIACEMFSATLKLQFSRCRRKKNGSQRVNWLKRHLTKSKQPHQAHWSLPLLAGRSVLVPKLVDFNLWPAIIL